jgi:hypothetical protein
VIAFRNTTVTKAAVLRQLRAHTKADELIKGCYWERGKGCAVGCTIHSSKHVEYESRFGIPQMLAQLEDCIFEGLPNAQAKVWPVIFMSAVKPGSDLSCIGWCFLHWLLTDEAVNPGINHPLVSAAIKQCAYILIPLTKGLPLRSAESAASAANAAWSAAHAAANAAWSAAHAAERVGAGGAANSAESAASAANAAWSAANAAERVRAERAAKSAESAASAANAAWSAARAAARAGAESAARAERAERAWSAARAAARAGAESAESAESAEREERTWNAARAWSAANAASNAAWSPDRNAENAAYVRMSAKLIEFLKAAPMAEPAE